MLQQLQALIEQGENRQAKDLEEILTELTWSQEKQCYYGSQSAVARITGMARFGIEQGLQLGNTPPVKRPKLLKWLVGEGVSGPVAHRQRGGLSG